MTDPIEDESFKTVIGYWASLRRGRSMPSRADIDPLDLPGKLWPHLTLVDVLYDEGRERFRYRRVGAVFVEAMGRDPTGMFLEDILRVEGGHLDYIGGLYRDVVATRKPIYSENQLWRDGLPQPHRQTRRLLAPLSSDDQSVDMVLVVHIYKYLSQLEKAAGEVRGIVENQRVILDP